MIAAPPTARRPPTPFAALGLRDDPFPRDPLAGAYVPLPGQDAVLDDVRAWLGSDDANAPGLAVIAGESGSGKTRLLQQLVLAIADDDRLIGVAPDDGLRRTDAHLLRTAIVALGGTPAGRTGLELTTELRAILDSHREDPLPPVLLIDNAALTGSQLEILRGVLTNPDLGAPPTRAQVVLAGPTALPDRIARRRSLADLTRRVGTMPPLDRDAARTLLNGRIGAVREPGSMEWDAGPLIDEPALGILFDASGGAPGILLALAHAALRETIATARRQVDVGTAWQITRATLDVDEPARPPADAAIQTRLLLPGVEADAGTVIASRRRGRQP